jgi:hypothetical protein
MDFCLIPGNIVSVEKNNPVTQHFHFLHNLLSTPASHE